MNETIRQYVSYTLDRFAITNLYPERVEVDILLKQDITHRIEERRAILHDRMTEKEKEISSAIVSEVRDKIRTSEAPSSNLIAYTSLAVSLMNTNIFNCGEPPEHVKDTDLRMQKIWDTMTTSDKDKAGLMLKNMGIDTDLSMDISPQVYLRRMVRLAKARGLLCVLARTCACICDRTEDNPLLEALTTNDLHSLYIPPDEDTSNAMSLVFCPGYHARLRFKGSYTTEDLWIEITRFAEESEQTGDEEIIGTIMAEPSQIQGFSQGDTISFSKKEIQDLFYQADEHTNYPSAVVSIINEVQTTCGYSAQPDPEEIWKRMSFRERSHMMSIYADLRKIKKAWLPDVRNNNVLPPDRGAAASP